MESVKLSENLTLFSIESIVVGGVGRCYECFFDFFKEEGRMIVSEKCWEEQDLNYLLLEITCEELWRSFEDMVDNKHWPTIQKHIKAFIQNELETAEE